MARIILWLSLCLATAAQADVFRHFGVDQGLSNGTVLDVVEDGDGLLWVGTEDGLFRISDRVIRRVDRLGKDLLTEDPVFYAIQPLSDQRLLLSTMQGLVVLDIAEHRFDYLHHSLPQLPSALYTRSFFRNKRGQVWFVTGEGVLFELNDSLTELRQLAQLPADERWRDVWQQSDGTLWVLGRNQLWQLSADGVVLEQDHWPASRGELRSLLEISPNEALLASSHGLYRLDLNRKRVSPEPILTGRLWDLAQEPDGDLWLLGKGGLWYWPVTESEPHQVTTPWSNDFRTEMSYRMTLDSRQQLWLMSDFQGLLGVRANSGLVTELYDQQRYPQMTSATVWHIFADGSQRYLASPGGVQWFDRASGEYQMIELPGLGPVGDAFALQPLDDDILMVATSSGLYQIDRHSRQAARFDPEEDIALRQRQVLNLLPDGDDFWILTDLYLLHWSPERNLIEPFEVDGEPLIGVRNLVRDDNNRLWLAGDNVWGFSDADGSYTSLLALLPEGQRSHFVSTIQPLPHNRVWFGSFGRGLWQYDGRWQELTPIGDTWGIQCDNPNFTQMIDNRVFLACNKYLYRIDPARDEVIGLDQYDGLEMTGYNEGAYFYSPEQGLMMGSVRGMVVVDPDYFASQEQGERPLIESLQIQYQDGQRQLLLRPEVRPTVIEPHYHQIRIQFANNRLLDRSSKMFRYRLNHNGEQGELHEQSQHGQLIFGQLPYGDYELELFGIRQGGWYAMPSRLQFTIAPYWWQRHEIRLGAAAALPLFLLVLLWVRSRRLQRSRRDLYQLVGNQKKLQLALSAGGSDTWEWDASSNRIRLQDRRRLFSAKGEPIEMDILTLRLHPDDRLRVHQTWQAHVLGQTERYEIKYRQADHQGHWRWLWVTGQAQQRDPRSQRALSMTGIYTDITESRRMEEEHSLYALAFDHAAEGALILDRHCNIHVCNSAAAAILGTEKSLLSGANFSHYWLREQDTPLSRLLQQGESWRGEVTLLPQHGAPLPVSLTLNTMGEEGEQRWILLFSDISERKRTELAMARMANYDALTGLLNRSHFNLQLEQVLEQNELLGAEAGLMFLDLDRFKHINDTYGHSTGDALLVEAARRLQEELSGSELLCRFGGDEFMVLVPQVEQRAQLEALANAFLTTIAEPFEVEGQVFYLSTSVGIACWPQDAQQAENLIKNADLAMYQAKDAGRGQLCFYSSQRNAQATYQLALDKVLRQALEGDRLRLHYQPQWDLLLERPVGVEALLRCYDPQAGDMDPAQFVELAEANGFVTKLDRWALKRACEEFSRWGMDDRLVLSVNVSPTHFRESDFVEYVTQVLERCGLHPSRLCLEITERVLMRQVPLAKRHLQALRRLGVKVAIDDFGTGYSSLAYLSQFAVDQLKIDRSFVHDLPDNRTQTAIAQSILDLGRNLELTVLAEGVETPDQVSFLKGQGCHLVQGFHFARPMGSEACCNWLRERLSPPLLEPAVTQLSHNTEEAAQ